MSKQKKIGRAKLPKRFLGVKIPKATRHNLNAMLKQLPTSAAKPLLGAAVGTLVTALATRLETPLRELIESHTAPGKGRDKPAAPTAH